MNIINSACPTSIYCRFRFTSNARECVRVRVEGAWYFVRHAKPRKTKHNSQKLFSVCLRGILMHTLVPCSQARIHRCSKWSEIDSIFCCHVHEKREISNNRSSTTSRLDQDSLPALYIGLLQSRQYKRGYCRPSQMWPAVPGSRSQTSCWSWARGVKWMWRACWSRLVRALISFAPNWV